MSICESLGCDSTFPARGTKRFCSRDCARAARAFEVSCALCGSVFRTTDKRSSYCSRPCARRGYSKPAAQNKIEKVCEHCSTVFVGKRGNRAYCSNSCAQQFRRTKALAPWIRGEVPASKASGELSMPAKRHLIEQAGNKCPRCGWGEPNPVLGYPILTIDHIDGDWTNNYISNLRVLCFNCHTLTETFGSLNRGTKSPRSKDTRKVHEAPMEK